jgi:hypothetical protein
MSACQIRKGDNKASTFRQQVVANVQWFAFGFDKCIMADQWLDQ